MIKEPTHFLTIGLVAPYENLSPLIWNRNTLDRRKVLSHQIIQRIDRRLYGPRHSAVPDKAPVTLICETRSKSGQPEYAHFHIAIDLSECLTRFNDRWTDIKNTLTQLISGFGFFANIDIRPVYDAVSLSAYIGKNAAHDAASMIVRERRVSSSAIARCDSSIGSGDEGGPVQDKLSLDLYPNPSASLYPNPSAQPSIPHPVPSPVNIPPSSHQAHLKDIVTRLRAHKDIHGSLKGYTSYIHPVTPDPEPVPVKPSSTVLDRVRELVRLKGTVTAAPLVKPSLKRRTKPAKTVKPPPVSDEALVAYVMEPPVKRRRRSEN